MVGRPNSAQAVPNSPNRCRSPIEASHPRTSVAGRNGPSAIRREALRPQEPFSAPLAVESTDCLNVRLRAWDRSPDTPTDADGRNRGSEGVCSRRGSGAGPPGTRDAAPLPGCPLWRASQRRDASGHDVSCIFRWRLAGRQEAVDGLE
jgi:hypothetical protein